MRKRLANSWLKQVRVCDVKLHELAAKLERFKHLDDIGAGHVLAEIGTVAARRSEIKTVESATIAALEHQTIEKTPYCKAIRDALKKLHGRIFEGLTNKAYFTELVEIIIGTKSPWCATSVQPLSTCHGTQFMPLVQAEAAQFLRAGGIAMGTPLSFPTSTAWSRPPPVTMYRLLGPSPVTWCYTSGALPGPASAGSMQSPLPRLALLPP
ncbi:MAG: hypothetical protein CL678_01105 [Bdellovibrionaceae bacterium]|nr:hypothetical protein [Pseudobdellovibrionaceae bacterium]